MRRRLPVRLTRERHRGSEELYRSLVEQLPAFAYVDALDPASSWGTRTVYASPQVEQLLGVTAQAFVDEPGLWDQLVHPDDREREHALYARLLATGEPYSSEFRLVRADGRIVWIRHQAVPLLGVPGADGAVQGVIYDITAGREAHQALLDSQARFRALLEEAPDAVLVVDAQGAILMANRRAEHIFGFDPHELAGRPVEDLIPEHLRRAHVGHRARYGADPSTRYEALELSGRRKDGTMFPAEISLGFVPVEGEEPIVMAFVRDVTARKRGEAALLEAEERYRTLVERIPAIVYVAAFGEPAPWLFVSPQAGHILGYEPEEWIADDALWMRLIHPGDLERVLQAERASRASGERFECEYRMFARDGREVWIRDEAEVVLDDTGARALLRGIMYDVTGRRLAEDAVRASEERFRLLSDAAVEGVIVDVDGRIVEANHAFSQMFGLDPREVVGSSPQDAVAPESLPFVLQYLTSGSDVTTDLDIVRRKDGVRLVVEATLRHVEHSGRPARLVTLHDITARKQAEAALAGLNDVLDQRVRERTLDLQAANAELTTAREVAEEANRAKSEFLSRASHELRTPLNAILGFGQLLQMASLPEDDEESVEQILTAGRRLLELVDRVLDIARADAGAASVSLGIVALDAVVEESLAIVRAAAEMGGVLIRPELRSPVPMVIADGERLAQVFAQILSNAVEHSREGDVVTLWCERSEGSVRVHISDRGPGIPEESMERLFALFGTLEGQTGVRQGPGVGLPLAKTWVEAMGGTLGVRSEVGVGTTFTVELAAADQPVR